MITGYILILLLMILLALYYEAICQIGVLYFIAECLAILMVVVIDHYREIYRTVKKVNKEIGKRSKKAIVKGCKKIIKRLGD